MKKNRQKLAKHYKERGIKNHPYYKESKQTEKKNFEKDIMTDEEINKEFEKPLTSEKEIKEIKDEVEEIKNE